MTENAKMRSNAFFEIAPKANTSSYILFDHFYAFGLSRNNCFSVANNGEMKGGGYFRLCPPLGPRQFDWTKLANFTSRSCIQ